MQEELTAEAPVAKVLAAAPGGGTGIPGAGVAPDRAEMKDPDYAKTLDDEIAGTEAFKFAGGQGAAGEKWRKTIRGYVATNCKMLLLS